MSKVTKADIKKVMAAMGKKGGQRRAKKLTAAERQAIATKGGRAKAAKRRATR
jgi:hypothetical protein